MKFKNIAVLTTALDSDVQAETLRGIEKYGKEKGYNVSVFFWYAGSIERERQSLGEVNIITLPDLNLFDGLIVFGNIFHTNVRQQLINDVLDKVKCPIVTIGCKIGTHASVCTDNYTAMRELVEHYVVEHQMTRLHFVKGVEGNPDGEARYQAYIDVLTEHGIPILPERVSHGDFYVSGGEQAVKELLALDIEFPEVVICANDIMAVAVCDGLMAKGYRVPEDVAISGYDYSIEGWEHNPVITSVRSRSYDLGSKACELLHNEINGNVLSCDDNSILLPDEVILGESCGCINNNLNTEQSRKYKIADAVQRKIIYQLLVMENDIMDCNGISDWLKCVEDFVDHIDPPELYWCVNEDFIESMFELDFIEQEELSISEKLAYTEDVRVLLAYKNGVFHQKNRFKSKLALDLLFKDADKPRLFIFSPMHYLENNFGYLVFVDSDFPVGNALYISCLIKISHSVENIRKQNMLKNAMSRLDDMYIRDSLTGVFNRFGMERIFSDIKKKGMMSRAVMMLSFIDLDGLKNINDNYGHEEGDRIINATAAVLKKASDKFKVVRYGGDEFIVMGIIRDERETVTYWNNVKKEIDAYNDKMNKPAKLSLSYGYEVFKVDAKTSLEECINISDKKMYEVKKKKHSGER